ncbi:MAG: GDP-mannose 4,6-dehydratase [Sulfuriferula sp.]|nr:GDP-mannose 4,6-dehydratase [Sulfuriferula sp.]
MHVLITGGAGFIGSHLAEYHLARNDQVHVVDNLNTGSYDNIKPLLDNVAFRFDEADIVTWSGLDKAVGWADRIYHMAAVVGVKKVLADPVSVMATNIAGCERVMRAMHQGRWNPQLIVASSSEVYGFNDNPGFDENDAVVFHSGSRLRWCYAVTKLADESFGYAYAQKYGLNIVIARLFNTIGPRQIGRYGMVVPSFVKQAVNGHPVTVYGDGTQTRSFCDVRDTVRALDLLAATPAAKGEIVNVGNDQEIAIKDLARLVADRAKSASPIQFISYGEAYGVEFEDVSHRRPILTKLRALTGFEPKWTLVDSIDDLISRERSVGVPVNEMITG